MDDQPEIRTPAGVLPAGGLPPEAPLADAIFFRIADDGELVQIFAVRPNLDLENVDLPREEQRVEIVATFAMQKKDLHHLTAAALFIGPPTPPGRNRPCYCGSGRKFKHCHGSVGGA